MFSFVYAIAGAWREILHISEWTGMSVGALAGAAAIIYLDPTARVFAIRAAIFVTVAYIGALYAYHLGTADKQAQWNAANARAAAQIAQRDQEAPAVADAKIEVAALRKAAALDQEQINALRHADATCHPLSVNQLR